MDELKLLAEESYAYTKRSAKKHAHLGNITSELRNKLLVTYNRKLVLIDDA